MDGDACGIAEHAALVVEVRPVPQHERVAVIARRPPRALAGREIRAGHRRIIAAGPAAEGDLADDQYDGNARHRAHDVARRRQAAADLDPALAVLDFDFCELRRVEQLGPAEVGTFEKATNREDAFCPRRETAVTGDAHIARTWSIAQPWLHGMAAT